MATPTIPTTEPASILAGSTLKWSKCLPDYPATDGWTLTYKFRGPSVGFDVEAEADGSDYLITVAAEDTETMVSGTWFYQGWVEKDGEKYPIASGQVIVTAALPDEEEIYDGRSQFKRILDAIDAMLAGKATLDQQEYQIGDRMLARIPIPDLIKLRETYAKLVFQEQQVEAANDGRPILKTILTRFTTPE